MHGLLQSNFAFLSSSSLSLSLSHSLSIYLSTLDLVLFGGLIDVYTSSNWLPIHSFIDDWFTTDIRHENMPKPWKLLSFSALLLILSTYRRFSKSCSAKYSTSNATSSKFKPLVTPLLNIDRMCEETFWSHSGFCFLFLYFFLVLSCLYLSFILYAWENEMFYRFSDFSFVVFTESWESIILGSNQERSCSLIYFKHQPPPTPKAIHPRWNETDESWRLEIINKTQINKGREREREKKNLVQQAGLLVPVLDVGQGCFSLCCIQRHHIPNTKMNELV